MVSISLLRLLIFSFIRNIFSLPHFLNKITEIIVTLKSLSANSNICYIGVHFGFSFFLEDGSYFPHLSLLSCILDLVDSVSFSEECWYFCFSKKIALIRLKLQTQISDQYPVLEVYLVNVWFRGQSEIWERFIHGTWGYVDLVLSGIYFSFISNSACPKLCQLVLQARYL